MAFLLKSGCLGSLETGTAGEEDGVGAEGVLNMDSLTDPEKQQILLRKPRWMHWQSPLAPRTVYRSSRPPSKNILAIDRIKAIHRRRYHLVMHGSSSVTQELLQEINTYGGEIAETYGVRWKKFSKASSTVCER